MQAKSALTLGLDQTPSHSVALPATSTTSDCGSSTPSTSSTTRSPSRGRSRTDVAILLNRRRVSCPEVGNIASIDLLEEIQYTDVDAEALASLCYHLRDWQLFGQPEHGAEALSL